MLILSCHAYLASKNLQFHLMRIFFQLQFITTTEANSLLDVKNLHHFFSHTWLTHAAPDPNERNPSICWN